MTNLITLTIPNDDHVALRAFGKALEEMALAHGAEPKQTGIWVERVTVSKADDVKTLSEEESRNLAEKIRKEIEKDTVRVDTTTEQFEALAKMESAESDQPAKGLVQTEDGQFDLSTGAQVDSTNTPWDERIHSASKALNADGTWRLRRKPKDMDEAEWVYFVDEVKAELTGVTETPLEAHETDDFVVSVASAPHDVDPDTIPKEEFKEVTGFIEPPVTPPGDDFHTDAGVVTEQTVAGIPPIPVPPPAVVPPALVYDFPGLMKFLTERHGKIDVPTVNQLLAVDGLAALTDLNAHPDKIGSFVARVKAHLGE